MGLVPAAGSGEGGNLRRETLVDKGGGIELEDLSKFGLIPEFIGRVPVTARLEELDKQTLRRILVEPKNAITRQYQQLLKFDKIELEFKGEALDEVADIALEKKTGARGLRAILEQVMLEVMYDLPSNEKVSKCIITKNSVLGLELPTLEEGEKVSFEGEGEGSAFPPTILDKPGLESA